MIWVSKTFAFSAYSLCSLCKRPCVSSSKLSKLRNASEDFCTLVLALLLFGVFWLWPTFFTSCSHLRFSRRNELLHSCYGAFFGCVKAPGRKLILSQPREQKRICTQEYPYKYGRVPRPGWAYRPACIGKPSTAKGRRSEQSHPRNPHHVRKTGSSECTGLHSHGLPQCLSVDAQSWLHEHLKTVVSSLSHEMARVSHPLVAPSGKHSSSINV